MATGRENEQASGLLREPSRTPGRSSPDLASYRSSPEPDESLTDTPGLGKPPIEEFTIDVSNSNESASDKQRSRNQTGLLRSLKIWWLELIACVVAVISVLAIVITLSIYDGHSLPSWPFGITVNALISTFSSILKVAMLVPVVEAISQIKWSWFGKRRALIDLVKFDEASRGAWGSFKLIVGLHGTSLALLGAAIMILATASDPFIQQVVNYKTCRINLKGSTATLARTNVYHAHGRSCDVAGGTDCQLLNLPMRTAVNRATYGSFTLVEPVCDTGNCTFSDFRTLGMCSGCRDISDEIHEMPLRKAPNGTLVAEKDVPNGANWEFYGKIWLVGDGYLQVDLTNVDPRQMSLFSANEYWLPTPRLLTKSKVITNITPHGFDGPSFKKAFECSLWPCVRTYNATVKNGKAKEKLVSTYNMSRLPGGRHGGYAATPDPCLTKGAYHKLETLEGKGPGKILVDGLAPQEQPAWLPEECYYELPDALGLSQFVTNFLTGVVNDTKTDFSATSQWMEKLYHDGSPAIATMNDSWADLAESMTVHMREHGAPGNSTPAYGTTWRTETCIRARWSWLSFPVALLVLTIGLLLATIIDSGLQGSKRAWKSSPLPLLFHGFDASLAGSGRQLDRTEEMEEKAETLNVKLSDRGGDVSFTQDPKY